MTNPQPPTPQVNNAVREAIRMHSDSECGDCKFVMGDCTEVEKSTILDHGILVVYDCREFEYYGRFA